MQEGRAFRFGIFELDLQARELRRRGVSVRLQEKPFQILELLLERAGEVVPRKDLRQKLWPDTFVGFDRSLNTAVNSLRRALGDLPGNPRFLETRSRQGYRFIAPVEAIPRRLVRGAQDAALDSIAVLPFRNVSGDSEMEYLSDGISETLINKLSRLPDVRVMARSTVFRYKGREVDPQTVGHELNVRALLTGSVMQRADTLTIGAELVDASKGWRLWGEQYSVAFTDIFAVQDEISREITEKLRLRLTEEARKRVARHYTADPEAYRDYLRGMYHGNKMTEDGLKKGIVHFERAIQRDPHFALPYAGLSDSYALFAYFGIFPSREVMPKAEQAARKALAIDQNLGEVHVSLAGILKSFHWDWSGAEVEYGKAIELSPNYARAHQWYADFLASQKRTDEAIREMDRALELDPLSLIINMEMAWVLYMAHEYERAIEQALKTIEIEPQFSPAHHVLGLANEQMGNQEDAVRSCKKAHDGSGGNPISLAALGHAYAAAGHKPEARGILNELRDQAKRGYVSPYALAIVCAGMGNRAQSLDWLQKAHDERDAWLVWIQPDPRLDCLRQEPRFHDLQRRMTLPAE
ncbi:MAG: winged helix-turn-helix domain-containing protein [Terriglobia bacterium]